ncbi:hypothetical protein [Actibacterium sp. 188UL27-1]|uniref:hypothetical protein n=1 Tax=Actibacterium sp. 188UL27-1 TaxID=2786961 RepID=UPI00195DA8C3|nr:hypothetical protein [Actibacterium sp. 188UL27-1]MBM7070298.1 hypothetical protein [Actibacterium sp. 188UL27-1]
MESSNDTWQIAVPGFVTITDVTADGAAEPEFVISNEATGKYFRANRATVQFLDALKRFGSIDAAAAETGLLPPHVTGMMEQLRSAGIVIETGQTRQALAPKAPLEGKLISLRRDLMNAGPLTRRLEPLGRFLFSPPGYLAWSIAVIASLTQLIQNRDKVLYSLQKLPGQGGQSLLMLAVLYVGVKVIHEMGHALAYRRFCVRAGFDPGPIRMGIALFAMTPFPFTDVTGAWRLRSRFERVMIGAGGMYAETWIIAILTTIWAHVQAGPAQSMILQVVVISGALALLFNLNPAVKLDGYYMLTDAIRRPNLAQRGSIAARTWLARRLGAELPAVDRFDLSYWTLAYLYRWTIFAGIFWLSYRFDPNVALVVLAVTVMMLVVRPGLATIRFLRTQTLRPLRLFAAGSVTALVVVALFVPLPDRVLVPGHYLHYQTRFIEAPETARLEQSGGTLTLDNPSLTEDLTTVRLRRIAVQNTLRSVSATAAERAGLQADIQRLMAVEGELAARLARLDLALPDTAVWTALGAEALTGAWVLAAGDPLGALSDPVAPFLRLRLPQSALQRDLVLARGVTVQARPRHDPACTVTATLTTQLDQAPILEDRVILNATPSPDAPTCAADLPSGTALVVRLDAPDKTLLARARITASRLLQDRLPVNEVPAQ